MKYRFRQDNYHHAKWRWPRKNNHKELFQFGVSFSFLLIEKMAGPDLLLADRASESLAILLKSCATGRPPFLLDQTECNNQQTEAAGRP
jgi:hypothetical protein